ncbi:MAG: hypothetical protein ACKPEA_00515 [Planctomycetota bacterium]
MSEFTHLMRLAARLAVRGHGQVEPNPMVGCVVLDREGAVAGWVTTARSADRTPRWKP